MTVQGKLAERVLFVNRAINKKPDSMYPSFMVFNKGMLIATDGFRLHGFKPTMEEVSQLGLEDNGCYKIVTKKVTKKGNIVEIGKIGEISDNSFKVFPMNWTMVIPFDTYEGEYKNLENSVLFTINTSCIRIPITTSIITKTIGKLFNSSYIEDIFINLKDIDKLYIYNKYSRENAPILIYDKDKTILAIISPVLSREEKVSIIKTDGHGVCAKDYGLQ